MNVFVLLLTLLFCELDYKLHPTKIFVSLYKVVYTQEMASIVADRSCSENYIFPLIVSGCYILPQVEIPVLFKEKSM